MSDTRSLQNIISQSVAYDHDKFDIRANVGSQVAFQPSDDNKQVLINVEENDGIGGLFNGDSDTAINTVLSLEDHALQQVCNRLGPPPSRYIRQCPGGLAATNLNHWVTRYDPGKEWLVRGYGNTTRAILSDSYAPIQNTKVLELVQEAIGDNGYNLIRPWVGRDGMYLKVVVFNRTSEDDGNYGVGFIVRNGEVGKRKIQIASLIQRDSCTNSIVINDADAFNKRHQHVSAAWLEGEVAARINAAVGRSDDYIDNIYRAKRQEIPRLGSVIAGLCKKHGYGDDIREAVLMGTEASQTRMGLVNGLSYAAHAVELDADKQFELESLAGKFFVKGNEAALSLNVQ